MLSIQADVQAFHEKMGLTYEPYPTPYTEEDKALRKSLITEESHEANDAIDSDIPEDIAKELVDIIYVAVGAAVSRGLDLEPIWKAVHESNMAKVGGKTRPDGKILKPKDWQPPGVGDLVADQILAGMEANHYADS